MLDLLKRTVELSNLCEQYWDEINANRRAIAKALLDPSTDTSDIAPYVTTSNRTSRLDLPELNELKAQISARQQHLFDIRKDEIYQAQLQLQAADEHLAALLTDEELDELTKRYEQLAAKLADSAPEQTRSLVMRRGARQSITGMLGGQ
jgi:hypothetical protein